MICTESFTQRINDIDIVVEALVLYVRNCRFILAVNSYIEVTQ